MINKWRDGALLYIGRCRCELASVRDLAAHKTVDESGFGVHCGAASLPVTPILTEQVVDEELTLHTTPVGHGTLFALNVRGDSMIDAAIFNGDIVVVRQQTVADNGDIVAAMIDDEATVKVYRTRGGCGNSFG